MTKNAAIVANIDKIMESGEIENFSSPRINWGKIFICNKNLSYDEQTHWSTKWNSQVIRT